MGIELTSAELLIMSEMDSIKQRFRAEQAAKAAEIHVDYTTEGFEYPQELGHIGLVSTVETPEVVLEVAA